MKLDVVKVGGALLEDEAALAAMLARFASLQGARVLVHGGGRSATALASRLGVETRMAEGRRITDAPMLEIVTMVYGGLVNKRAVAALQALGINALGLTGADLGYMRGHRRPAGKIDYGFVGDVDSVDISKLESLIASGVVPVLAPLVYDGSGGLLNTNADTIASKAAVAFAGRFEVCLTFCFEAPGVLADPSDKGSVIPHITPSIFESFKAEGIISGGMIPKLDNAFDALRAGVKQVRITDIAGIGSDGGTLVTLE